MGADRGRRIAGGICIRSARKGVGAGRGLGRGRTGDANCLRYGLPRRQAYSKRDGQAGQNRKPQGSAAQRAASEETRLPALLRRSNRRTQGRNGPDCAGDRLNHFYPPIARAIAIADGPLY